MFFFVLNRSEFRQKWIAYVISELLRIVPAKLLVEFKGVMPWDLIGAMRSPIVEGGGF